MLTIVLLHSIPVFLVAYYTRRLFALNVAAAISAVIAIFSGDIRYLIFDLVGIGIAYFAGRKFALVSSDTERARNTLQQYHQDSGNNGVGAFLEPIRAYASRKRLDFELYRRGTYPTLIDLQLRRAVESTIRRILIDYGAAYKASEFPAHIHSAYSLGADIIIITHFGPEVAKARIGASQYQRTMSLLSGNHDWDLYGSLASALGRICRRSPAESDYLRQGRNEADQTSWSEAKIGGSIVHVNPASQKDCKKEDAEKSSTPKEWDGLGWWGVVALSVAIGAFVLFALSLNGGAQQAPASVTPTLAPTKSLSSTAPQTGMTTSSPDPMMIREIQLRLNAMKYEAGPVDGIAGPLTRGAITRFQQEFNLVVDQKAYRSVLDALRRNSDCVLTSGQMTTQDYRRCGLSPPSH